MQFLEEYNFSLEYIPGKENVTADHLSRDMTDSDVHAPCNVTDVLTSEVKPKATSCASQNIARIEVDDDEVENVIKRHREYGHLRALKTKFSILNSNLYFKNMIPASEIISMNVSFAHKISLTRANVSRVLFQNMKSNHSNWFP